MKQVVFYEAEQLRKLQRKAFTVEAVVYLFLFVLPFVGFIYLYHAKYAFAGAFIALLVPYFIVMSAAGEHLAIYITKRLFSRYYPACTVLNKYYRDIKAGDHVYYVFLDYKTAFLLTPRCLLQNEKPVDEQKIKEEINAFVFEHKDTCAFFFLD